MDSKSNPNLDDNDQYLRDYACKELEPLEIQTFKSHSLDATKAMETAKRHSLGLPYYKAQGLRYWRTLPDSRCRHDSDS